MEGTETIKIFIEQVADFKAVYLEWKEARTETFKVLDELIGDLKDVSQKINLTNISTATLGAPVGVVGILSGALVLAAPFTSGVTMAAAGVVLAGSGVAGALLGGANVAANLSHYGIKHQQRKRFHEIIDADRQHMAKLQEVKLDFLSKFPEMYLSVTEKCSNCEKKDHSCSLKQQSHHVIGDSEKKSNSTAHMTTVSNVKKNTKTVPQEKKITKILDEESRSANDEENKKDVSKGKTYYYTSEKKTADESFKVFSFQKSTGENLEQIRSGVSSLFSLAKEKVSHAISTVNPRALIPLEHEESEKYDSFKIEGKEDKDKINEDGFVEVMEKPLVELPVTQPSHLSNCQVKFRKKQLSDGAQDNEVQEFTESNDCQLVISTNIPTTGKKSESDHLMESILKSNIFYPTEDQKFLAKSTYKGVKSVDKFGSSALRTYEELMTLSKVVRAGEKGLAFSESSAGSTAVVSAVAGSGAGAASTSAGEAAGAAASVAGTTTSVATKVGANLTRLLQVGGLALGALGVVSDIGSIVYYATEIHKGSPCDLATEITYYNVVLKKEFAQVNQQCQLFFIECDKLCLDVDINH